MTIEQELQSMDFSHLSKVKESLRRQLHQELSGRTELSLDDLDQVAAAGNPTGSKPHSDPKP